MNIPEKQPREFAGGKTSTYAGIGNRYGVPDLQQEVIRRTGQYYAKSHTLRSGGAIGCDSWFEEGCDMALGAKEIYTAKSNIPEWAFELVYLFHPAPNKLSDYTMRLMARNGMIILGADGSVHADFVVCYTSNEQHGGTAYAIRLAREYGIPVSNLANQRDLDIALNFLYRRNG